MRPADDRARGTGRKPPPRPHAPTERLEAERQRRDLLALVRSALQEKAGRSR